MRETPPPHHLSRYVEELVECGVQLAEILDHMYRYPHSAPDAPPPPEVLRDLVAKTLAPKLGRRKRDVHTATALLLETSETISQEIFLVNPDFEDALDDPDDLDDFEPDPDFPPTNGNGRGPSGEIFH
jgi:hypothetical protein